MKWWWSILIPLSLAHAENLVVTRGMSFSIGGDGISIGLPKTSGASPADGRRDIAVSQDGGKYTATFSIFGNANSPRGAAPPVLRYSPPPSSLTDSKEFFRPEENVARPASSRRQMAEPR